MSEPKKLVDRTKATNTTVNNVRDQIKTLIGWAEADALHDFKHGALIHLAEDDYRRVNTLKQAFELLGHCYR